MATEITPEDRPPPYEFNTLTTVAGRQQDNSIVEVNKNTLAGLRGIGVGTPVLLRAICTGSRGYVGETVCTVQENDLVVEGCLRINPCVKYTLGVQWGEQITIERCSNITFGRHLELAPVRDSLKGIESDLVEDFMKPYFSVGYRPVHVGDLFLITSPNGRDVVEFKVMQCQPSPMCLVSPNTSMVCGEPIPRDLNDNMLHEHIEHRIATAQTRAAANTEAGNTRRQIIVRLPADQARNLTQGDLVSLGTGADGQPRLQRITTTQGNGANTIAVSQTILINGSQYQTLRRSRNIRVGVRLFVCFLSILIGIIVGVSFALKSD